MLSKRVANYRPIVIVAIAISIGITLGAVAMMHIVAFYVLLSVLVVSASVLLFFKYKIPKLIAVFLLIGFSLITIHAQVVKPVDISIDNVYFEGRITDITSATSNSKEYVIKDITINGNEYPRKALVETTGEYKVGDIVGFVGDFDSIEYNLFNSYNVSRISKGISYQAETVASQKIGEDELTLSEKVKVKLTTIYTDNLGELDGGIALGLLIGDTEYIDYDTTEAMRISGLSHLFSVSGLHVGFMCTIIYGLFRLIKIPKRKSLLIVSAVLLAYGILTGFPVGVVRASIMALIMLVAEILEERNDPLNSLALTSIIILICSPIELFSLSFELSIGAVAGIVCFYRSMTHHFDDHKARVKKLVGGVAISLSANAFIVAISSYYFGTLSLYFIIANLIAVPVGSMVYTLLVPLSLIALIFEPLGILIMPLGFPIRFIRILATFISTLPMATVDFKLPLAGALLYSVGMVMLSKFNMGAKKQKIIICLTSFIACALIFFIF